MRCRAAGRCKGRIPGNSHSEACCPHTRRCTRAATLGKRFRSRHRRPSFRPRRPNQWTRRCPTHRRLRCHPSHWSRHPRSRHPSPPPRSRPSLAPPTESRRLRRPFRPCRRRWGRSQCHQFRSRPPGPAHCMPQGLRRDCKTSRPSFLVASRSPSSPRGPIQPVLARPQCSPRAMVSRKRSSYCLGTCSRCIP